MVRIFYHAADFDGVCSAAIVLRKHETAELHPVNYHDDFDDKIFSKVKKDDTIIMVDFSLNKVKPMIKLSKMCKEFIWIDHHQDIIEYAIESGFNPPGIRKNGTAGCALTWKYFFPEEPIPIGVDLIGKWDVRTIDNENIFPFYYGIEIYNKDPKLSIWEKIFTNDKNFIDNRIYDGKVIEHFVKKSNIASAMRGGSTVILGDYTAFLINDYVEIDYIKEAGLYKDTVHDFLMMFKKNRNHWKFSLRSSRDDVDVSAICSIFKGGGHKKASGFTIKDENFVGKLLKGRILIKKIEGAKNHG